jgi:ribonuclease HII
MIKGDNKLYSIAAASILAKVAHDNHICELCNLDCELDNKYNLLKNMGYGTKKHIDGIYKYGISIYHRKTFKPCY